MHFRVDFAHSSDLTGENHAILDRFRPNLSFFYVSLSFVKNLDKMNITYTYNK